MQQPTSRPFGVTVIGVLLAIHGVLAALAGLGLFGPYPGGFFGVAIQLIYAVVLLYLAVGMFQLQGWAWLTTLAFQVINIPFLVIVLFTEPTFVPVWIGLLLTVVIIAYLSRYQICPGIGYGTAQYLGSAGGGEHQFL